MSPATAAYRAGLSAIVGGLLARITAAWLVLYDPARPLWSAARLAELAAVWTEGAQLAAARSTVLWLSVLTADAYGAPLGQVEPYRIPAGLVGSTAAGSPLAGLLSLAPAIWWARFTAGATREDAAAAAAGWVGRIASSEPYRVANETTTRLADQDPRLTGRIGRVTRPGACQFCQLIRDRGYTPAKAGFPAHGNCKCTAEPEIGAIPA